MPDRQLLQPHRKALFQHFRVGHARIGHVALHRVAAMKPRSGPGSAADRLVVLETFIAPDEVVHRSLSRRHHPQRAIKRVAGRLAHFGIPGDHRRRRARVQQCPLRHDDRQRHKTAFVQGDRLAHQSAENIQDHSPGHSLRGIVVAAVLRAGAGKINRRTARLAVHLHRYMNGRSYIHGIRERSIAYPVDHRAHAILGVALDMPHVGRNRLCPMQSHHPQQFPPPGFICGDLGFQVGDVLVRRPAGPLA